MQTWTVCSNWVIYVILCTTCVSSGKGGKYGKDYLALSVLCLENNKVGHMQSKNS